MAITITGANGEVISLDDATGRAITEASALQTNINSAIASDPASVEVYTNSGTYEVSNANKYVVVANGDDSVTGAGAITINNGDAQNPLYVLSGREAGTIYNANNVYNTNTTTNIAKFVNTAGNLTFNGAGKVGSWALYTGDGDSTITTTDGNNQVNTGSGKNTIVLGTGNNSVYSEGQDTITGGGNGYQSVTLAGSKSEVTLGDNSLINDSSTGKDNTVSVGRNSTVFGGVSTTVTYNSGDQNVFQAGTSDTVNAAADSSALRVIHGSDNTFNVEKTLSLFNGNGDTNITVNGQFIGFGASDSNYTLNAGGNDSGFFVADKGNETLNASGSSANLLIYAYSVSGAQSSFEVSGGSGNDTLAAGTGNSTFSGGAGDNLFLFNKANAENGNTVITDFANSSQNKIGLFDYGLDNDSLNQLLQSSQNDTNGNAVLNLDGHTITIQGISVSDLNTNQFVVENDSLKTA